mmetsp:Transcript_55069/g.131229  ORF Transcript_55069/g.131229 Transcript_55069/m.131229 type:complete len:582 (+) Transcript_55069:284-2029(+)
MEVDSITSKANGYGSVATTEPYIKNGLPGKGGDGIAALQGGSSYGMPLVCFTILVVELCERLAFYSFTGTQEFFLEKVGYTLAQAGSLNASMSTLCMAWAVFAGWIADVWLGRYWTIFVFGITYVCGSAMAATAAMPSVTSSTWYLIGVMGLIPLGTAGIKSNISNFGADQYDVSDPQQAIAQEEFFSWFYLSINMGSAVSYGYLTTLASNGGLGIPQEYGYFAVYTLAAVAMMLAVVIFASFRRRYRINKIQESSPLLQVAKEAYAAGCQGNWEGLAFLGSWVLLFVAIALSVLVALTPKAGLPMLVCSSVCACIGVVTIVCCCRDPVWINASTSQGQAVREYVRLLPVLFTAAIAFTALYNAMQFWYQQQACQMDLRVGSQGFQFSGSFFMIADCFGIIAATPLAVGFVNPALERYFGNGFGHGTKFGIGMFFGALSILLACHLEINRRNAVVLDEDSHCAPSGVRMSDVSAVWMTAPFFLMGLGEVYTQPTIMYLAYSCSPPSMRTLAAVTFLLIQAVSDAVFTVQVSALSRFVPDDLNKGHLEYGYATCLLLGFALYMGFLYTWRSFESKVVAQAAA